MGSDGVVVVAPSLDQHLGLDGGHLMFYAYEAIRGKPLGERAQEYGFRIGLALVLTLMVFATWSDLEQLKVVDFVVGLFA